MELESEKVVVVAVRAEGEISKAALTWALTNIVCQGDLVTLLAVLPDARTGWRRWLWRGLPRRRPRRMEISASSTLMALQIDGDNKVNVRIKVVGAEGSHGHTCGDAVAAECKLVGAHWVVLDKNLNQERKQCLEELHCNIVVITKGSNAKVLRLNLGSSTKSSSLKHPTITPPATDSVITNSSLGQPGDGLSSSSRFVEELPEVVFHKTNPLFERFGNGKLTSLKEDNDNLMVGSDPFRSIPPGLLHQDGEAAHTQLNVNWISAENPISASIQMCSECYESTRPSPTHTAESRVMLVKDEVMPSHKVDAYKYYSYPREAAVSFVPISSASYSKPRPSPPLCSLCRHKAPLFGKPPRRFTYRDLVNATNGFSDGNFLGEDGIYRGILLDGQLVAVKQLQALNDFEDNGYEFHSEVQSLSRAQHRNIVMLLGFCIEGRHRMLVYEYVCNGSLDRHLHGGEQPLDWHARVKIAVGAARGLRYLHEDCRVGLVHGGLRTKNILLTHDFEPMVGGFTLTKCQSKKSRITETFGYQAPEYFEHGNVTEKADVYAFGVVLLEMLSGRRAMDITRPKGQQLLTEWARPIQSLTSQGSRAPVIEFLDPRLDRDQIYNLFSRELHVMYYAAFMCLRLDPQTRPNMSKVLRVFEGDVFLEPGSNFNMVGSRSSRMNNVSRLEPDVALGGSLRYLNEVSTNTLCEEKNWTAIR